MNNPSQIQHEEWMSEDDIGVYDNLISLGRLQLGKELAKNEEYLLHIASMITLKQIKGMLVDVNDETIVELKRIHKESFDAGLIHTTPPDTWYASAEALKTPYLDPEVEAEIDKANAITSNLILKSCEMDKKDELVVEDGVAKIKEGWVKLAIAEPA